MPIRLIQVGLGGWGRDWAANAIGEVAEIELVAAVEIDPATAALAQKTSRLPANRFFSSLEQACTTVDADAVLITAPLPAHVPLALEAIRLGKHVLSEKPFAPSLAEAQQVIDAAAAAKRVFMVSQNYRFFPAPQAVAALIREGRMGAPGMVALDFRRNVNATTSPRHRQLTDPLLADMSIHHFDLMRFVLGQEPVSVECHAWNPPWSNFIEPACAVATIRFDGGAVVSYRGSWISPGPQTAWAGEWHMDCGEGAIAWSSRAGLAPRTQADHVTLTANDGKAVPFTPPTVQHLGREGSLASLARAITTGEEPSTSGRDNIRSLALMYATIEASKTGETVLL